MNRILLPLPVMLTLTLVLAGCDEKAKLSPDQQTGPDPVMPKAQDYLMPPMQVPSGVGWKAGAQPDVAEGLSIEKMADGFLHPRMVYVLPNDDVLVVESNGPGEEPLTTPKQLIAGIVKNQSGKGGKGGNRITLLRKSGSGWEKHVFLEHLHSPFGVQLIGNNLYVANTDSIMRYPYQQGETHISDAGTELADLPNTINHHWTKALLASPDGKKLYVGVGSNSNITENGQDVEYRRANVLEVDTATGASRIFASGIRNPTGLGWEPQSGKLWAIANERDEIGADLVPDYLTSVQDGGFYGWPWSYFGQHVDRRVQPPRPDKVARAIKPDYALSSHVAPLGMQFYTGQMLPQKYRGGVFISEHGSWDRSPLNGYKVSFVAFKDSKPVGKPESVVSGFVSRDEKELYGAPVGLAQDNQGALIIADDVGNTVWRVTAK
ncbi:glucose/arabinose dehydrogenase [Raoultella sp. BIGb0149]|uniref:PQQ-dependent sugar dehydrogenase n=1 Tax=Raoultella TaxID=160674 RepID=UPI00105EFD5A|nr:MULTISPECIES: sorbosone dehydrogenase family protein [Raoultella]MCI1032136.1 sorbosone dehydrogenase family protein [Raoultella terrigena]TDQ26771.1 glucose/arabinose dehydrogenase [Raoultella sp. BIGb0149]